MAIFAILASSIASAVVVGSIASKSSLSLEGAFDGGFRIVHRSEVDALRAKDGSTSSSIVVVGSHDECILGMN